MVEAAKHELAEKSCPPGRAPQESLGLVDYGRVRGLLRPMVYRNVKALPMNPHTATQQLNGRLDVSLRLVIEAQRACGSAVVWDYLADLHGHLWVPRTRAAPGRRGAQDVRALTVQSAARLGEVAAYVEQMLADGHVSIEELAGFRQRIAALEAGAEALGRAVTVG